MQTKTTDSAFVMDAIHRVYKVNKVKIWIEFLKVAGWEITDTRMDYTTMAIEFYGKQAGEDDEKLIPDYPSDLEALRFAIVESKMVVGPEYSFFEKKNVPIGFAVYKNWDRIAIDHIDRMGSANAVSLSSDLNIAVMLAYMVLRGKKINLEGLR